MREIERTDRILKSYDSKGGDDATIVISQYGTIIRKWRVTSDNAGCIYQVDTTARICKAGREVVPCENVKRDVDMQQYIDW